MVGIRKICEHISRFGRKKLNKMKSEKVAVAVAVTVGSVLTMGLGGLLVGPVLAGIACVIAENKLANEKAARQRDVERRTRYHYHYRGD